MEKSKLTERTIDIPIDEWCALNFDDTHINVKIQISGRSMQPLIRRNKDFVTIQPMTRKIIEGDIVLFKNVDGRYIIHRVKQIYSDGIQTMGDNLMNPDAKIPKEAVLGYVTHIHRGRITIFVDTPMWRRLGRFWLSIIPLRKTVRFIFRPFKRILGRMVR